MADLADIPVEDTLFDASRLIVDAIERVGQGRDEPMIQPWMRQALVWAVGGLGYTPEDASVADILDLKYNLMSLQCKAKLNQRYSI